jgi:hypothetical protein
MGTSNITDYAADFTASCKPHRNFRKPGKASLGLAAMLTLSACAGQMGGQPLTPAQQQLQDANKRFAATTAEGAVAGAILGTLIGFAAGGARGALIGGLGGAAVGTAVGYSVSQNNFNQSHTEANLENLIQQSNVDAAAYERSAAASAQIVTDLHNQISELDSQFAAHTISVSQYQARISSYRSSADLMRKQVADMEKESDSLHADAANYGGSHSAELNGVAGRIDAARQSEEASLHDVDAAMSAVPAGA